MTNAQQLRLDVVIVGGGVAGLWLLARLRQQGYQAMLIETAALGAGQTRFAQGIIHGGTKYALTGKLTASSEAIAEMPRIWREAQQGKGELDLSAARLLSENHYLWSTASITSSMAGFFAKRVMRSRIESLAEADRPEAFQVPAFRGQVYRLDEPVFDTMSVIEALAEASKGAIIHATEINLQTSPATGLEIKTVSGEAWAITAQKVILTAGQGNEGLLQQAGLPEPQMQLRPLQMVMVRGDLPGKLFAHCLGASVNPRVTITSHTDSKGELVWYIGGQLAEDGVKRSREEQIAEAKKELASLMPWLDQSRLQWTTLMIDRAEPKMAGGKRPDNAFIHNEHGILTTWPTKMALSPMLANTVLQLLAEEKIEKSPVGALPVFAMPPCATLPWQEEERWN